MSRISFFKNETKEVVVGQDHVCGKFIQLYDKEVETPEGEGLILSFDTQFGLDTNYTGMSPKTETFNDVVCLVIDYVFKNDEPEENP